MDVSAQDTIVQVKESEAVTVVGRRILEPLGEATGKRVNGA
jgi:hypothetical protein